MRAFLEGNVTYPEVELVPLVTTCPATLHKSVWASGLSDFLKYGPEPI